ncbi:hypothetical protein ACS0TY_015434 [Phlomoides rotata]
MDRAAFKKLCFILQSACGLKCSRRVSVSKKVAIFLCVKFVFKRFGQTVSKHFHAVLNSVLSLHAMFLGCLGALDGTYIDVHVPITEKGRYRNRRVKSPSTY